MSRRPRASRGPRSTPETAEEWIPAFAGKRFGMHQDEADRKRVSGTAASSRLPPAEIDPRVDQHVGQIAEQLQHQSDQRKDVKRAKHDRVVAVDRRLEAEEP